MPLLEPESTPVVPKLAVSSGMRTFLLMWVGHMVSVLGSALTNFGIGVWIYRQTGSATGYAMMLLQ